MILKNSLNLYKNAMSFSLHYIGILPFIGKLISFKDSIQILSKYTKTKKIHNNFLANSYLYYLLYI